jgi:hypothetical protein
MKSILLCFTLALSLQYVGVCQNKEGKIDGLKFSKAFFVSLKTYELRDYEACDTTIVIEKGKVWNITSSKSFMVNDDNNPYENEISLWINDQIIYYYKSQFDCPIWLPEGKYKIVLKSQLRSKNLMFISYLSGIEYTIESVK